MARLGCFASACWGRERKCTQTTGDEDFCVLCYDTESAVLICTDDDDDDDDNYY